MDDAYCLLHGDCRERMQSLHAESVDSIVTDPPYGLAFMGKDWDHGVPGVAFWTEALRVTKPGAHLLAFGGTRTHHRLACAIEDAGWEVRDCIMWVYGSGFPKSHNLKDQWAGWGTALKPAWEPIIVARKPLCGTVAENVLRYGTGGINVDGCRVDASDGRPLIESRPDKALDETRHAYGSGLNGSRCVGSTTQGRWPANVMHDGSEEVVSLFPQTSSGSRKAGTYGIAAGHGRYGDYGDGHMPEIIGDSGSAARFFYCAKASKADRDEGCEDAAERRRSDARPNSPDLTGKFPDHDGRVRQGNHHPTVKPTALMRYLCRLVTQPKGVVLDPFMGSGSTGKAAMLEGFRFIGIEREAEYVEIARRRIEAAHAIQFAHE